MALVLTVAGGCGDTGPGDAASGQAYDIGGHAVRPLSKPEHPANLIVVVIDSLRADALPLDIGARAGSGVYPMPFLAGLAERGVACANAASSAPWTLPSVTSLLTGLLPSAHGQCTHRSHGSMVGAITTFAECLREAYGYDTAAFVDGPWFHGVGESVLQGFAHIEHDFALQGTGSRVGRWARYRDPGRPFFLLLHTFEVHDPYGRQNHPWPYMPLVPIPPDPSLLGPELDIAEMFRLTWLDMRAGVGLQRVLGPRLAQMLQSYAHQGYRADPRPDLVEELSAAYWGGVRWADGLLEVAVGRLKAEGLLDNTLLVVTADHGEGFGEHGSLSHGRQLYDELIRIPLVMVGPEPFAGGDVVQSSVGLIDLLPTFFDWVGLEPLEGIVGRSALTVVSGQDWCRPVLSEERLTRWNTGEDMDAIRLSARTERWKYIVTYHVRTGEVWEEAYDHLFDREERSDFANGTGRLPVELVMDPCFCPAVEAVRGRIWDRTVQEGSSAAAVPYGMVVPRLATPPPAPCRSTR